MATQNSCPMCGTNVPQDVTACPQCGEKVRREGSSAVDLSHSRVGIASFCIAILGCCALFGTLASVAYNRPTVTPARDTIIAFSFVGAAGMVLMLVGVMLGLVGVRLANRRNTFAVFGLVGSLIVFVTIGIVCMFVIVNEVSP